MALTEIEVAGTLVLIGFTIAAVTLSIIGVVFTWMGRSALIGDQSPAAEASPPDELDPPHDGA